VLHGIDPTDREQISVIASELAELINRDLGLPPLDELASAFADPTYGNDGKVLSQEDHVKGLCQVIIAAIVLLAEEKAVSINGHQMEAHLLMNGEAGPDHVEIRVGGYHDPRYAVAALARLQPDGYLDQMWSIAVDGIVDPNGPQVVFHDYNIKKED
jgi:hypothetical protein